ncbi:MAG: hypothetical protein RLZZ299_2878 [Pseudomonadota bacterium]
MMLALALASLAQAVPRVQHDLAVVRIDPAAAKACPRRARACPPALRGRSPSPMGSLAARGWHLLRAADAAAVVAKLRDTNEVWAYLAPAAAPPPSMTDPDAPTPDFSALQSWRGPLPGFGFDAAAAWPGGDGAFVRIANVEYGWDAMHEDLAAVPMTSAWGLHTGDWAFHGTSVFGMLVGSADGRGVTGAVPAAEMIGISPYASDGTYSVAMAIAGATALLSPGDVLLVEQQAYVLDTYGPVSFDPATWDAIDLATRAGIVVVEPGGNGALDLDDPAFGGWFDRDHDPGSIVVGGGTPPGRLRPARSWSQGSSHGSRVDVQGWYGDIVTTTGGEDAASWADLWFPAGDPRRAYTESFGGTSGAAPMVAAAAAVLQSVRLATGQAPLSPREVRTALASVGTPMEGEENVGPQPDVARLLETYVAP